MALFVLAAMCFAAVRSLYVGSIVTRNAAERRDGWVDAHWITLFSRDGKIGFAIADYRYGADDDVPPEPPRWEWFASPLNGWDPMPSLDPNRFSIAYKHLGPFESIHAINPNENYRAFAVHYWVPIAVLALPMLMMGIRAVRPFLAYRRLARGMCPICGYDLRATPDRCPECGFVVTKQDNPPPGA